uniref:hypothetical protein n=1 Tax=Escherichia coli TaxID=562 RepID=UPI0015EF14B9|nr:hypothetical protein [Escherichia coli]
MGKPEDATACQNLKGEPAEFGKNSPPTICNSATQRRNEQCIPCHNTLFRDAVSGRPVLTRQQRMKSL